MTLKRMLIFNCRSAVCVYEIFHQEKHPPIIIDRHKFQYRLMPQSYVSLEFISIDVIRYIDASSKELKSSTDKMLTEMFIRTLGP